jgi:hypothetical protein
VIRNPLNSPAFIKTDTGVIMDPEKLLEIARDMIEKGRQSSVIEMTGIPAI